MYPKCQHCSRLVAVQDHERAIISVVNQHSFMSYSLSVPLRRKVYQNKKKMSEEQVSDLTKSDF